MMKLDRSYFACCRTFVALSWVLVGAFGCDSEPATGPSHGMLRLGSVLGEISESSAGASHARSSYAHAEVVREFRFPADHGSHDRFRSEWWYLTVMLDDENGSEFGVQFTVFRQALKAQEISINPWQSVQVYLGHLAFTDVDNTTHREFQRIARGHPDLAGVAAKPFSVWLDGWKLRAVDDTFSQLELDARDEKFRVRLNLRPNKPIVLQGEKGLSRKGPGQASYYYSIPRMAVSGELWVDDNLHRVTGSAWFDREWSTSVLDAGQVGWDWFALHFYDDSEVMVFHLRRKDLQRDPHDHGVEVAVDGVSRALTGEDYQLTPLAFWRDENGVTWPVRWLFELDSRQFTIEAAIDDQRMDTALVYWEGLVHVRDESDRQVGRGYMELTGYADGGER